MSHINGAENFFDKASIGSSLTPEQPLDAPTSIRTTESKPLKVESRRSNGEVAIKGVNAEKGVQSDSSKKPVNLDTVDSN